MRRGEEGRGGGVREREYTCVNICSNGHLVHSVK